MAITKKDFYIFRGNKLELFLKFNGITDDVIPQLIAFDKKVNNLIFKYLPSKKFDLLKEEITHLLQNSNFESYEIALLFQGKTRYLIYFLTVNYEGNKNIIRRKLSAILHTPTKTHIDNIKPEKEPSGLYQISNKIGQFYFYYPDTETDEKKYLELTIPRNRQFVGYQLPNENWYNFKGELTKEAEIKDYDSYFIELLKSLDYNYHIPDAIDFHFEKTNDKERFWKHIKYHIQKSSKLNEPQKEQIDIWLEKNKSQKTFFTDVQKLMESEKEKYQIQANVFFKLQTFEEKLAFWNKENLPYNLQISNVYKEGNFSISAFAKEPNELELYNEFAIRQIKEIYKEEEKFLGFKVISFEGLKNLFYAKYFTVPLPDKYVENEIERIKNKFKEHPTHNRHFTEEYNSLINGEKWDLAKRLPYPYFFWNIFLRPYAAYLIFLEVGKFEEPATNYNPKQLFEKQVNQLTAFWIKFRLESRLSTAPEKALLIADEIKQTENILSGKTKNWQLNLNETRTVNSLEWYVESENFGICHYYKKIIIKNNPSYEFVTPQWEEEKQRGHNAVLAVALYRYKRHLEDVANDIPKYLENAKISKPSFDWAKLTQDLIDEKYIEENTPSDALQTFFINQTPKQKIKWIDKSSRSRSANKYTLFTLISEIDNSLIDELERSLFYKHIINSFTDKNNTVFLSKNLSSSLSDWHKRNDNSNREKELISIIQNLSN